MEEDFEDDQEFEGNGGIDVENPDGQQDAVLLTFCSKLLTSFSL